MEEQKQVPGWIGSCMGAVFALMFLGAGLLIILTSADVIHVAEENFKAPRTIVLAAWQFYFSHRPLLFLHNVFASKSSQLATYQPANQQTEDKGK